MIKSKREYNFLGFRVPKTASTSMDIAIKGTKYHEKTYSISRCTARYYRDLDTEDFKKRFKFAFVRNPYDRVLSYYFFTTHVHERRLKQNKPTKKNYNTFYEYVKTHEVHLRTQTCYNFLCENGKCLVDFIGNFEDLQHDFNKICNRIGIPLIVLPHMRKSGKREKRDYKYYYDDATYDLVTNIFKEDLKQFGYEY